MLKNSANSHNKSNVRLHVFSVWAKNTHGTSQCELYITPSSHARAHIHTLIPKWMSLNLSTATAMYTEESQCSGFWHHVITQILLQPLVTDFGKSGWDHMTGKSVSPTLLLLHRSLILCFQKCISLKINFHAFHAFWGHFIFYYSYLVRSWYQIISYLPAAVVVSLVPVSHKH